MGTVVLIEFITGPVRLSCLPCKIYLPDEIGRETCFIERDIVVTDSEMNVDFHVISADCHVSSLRCHGEAVGVANKVGVSSVRLSECDAGTICSCSSPVQEYIPADVLGEP